MVRAVRSLDCKIRNTGSTGLSDPVSAQTLTQKKVGSVKMYARCLIDEDFANYEFAARWFIERLDPREKQSAALEYRVCDQGEDS